MEPLMKKPINLFNPLIVWNNPFDIDAPLTKNQVVDLLKQKLKTVPE